MWLFLLILALVVAGIVRAVRSRAPKRYGICIIASSLRLRQAIAKRLSRRHAGPRFIARSPNEYTYGDFHGVNVVITHFERDSINGAIVTVNVMVDFPGACVLGVVDSASSGEFPIGTILCGNVFSCVTEPTGEPKISREVLPSRVQELHLVDIEGLRIARSVAYKHGIRQLSNEAFFRELELLRDSDAISNPAHGIAVALNRRRKSCAILMAITHKFSEAPDDFDLDPLCSAVVTACTGAQLQ